MVLQNVHDVQAIEVNAVCLHTGGEWDDLSKCSGFLQAFCYILVVCADPQRRQAIAGEIQSRVNYLPILVAEDPSFRDCKSVEELRGLYGPKAVDEILFYTKELPAYGLLNMADIKMPDVSKLPKVYSGIRELDQALGGFLLGQVTIWTGKRGMGKSTIVGEMLLESIDQGETVCAYSGELPGWQFKHWCQLQAAGPKYIRYTTDPVSGQKIETLPKVIDDRINEWWDKKFFVHDIGLSAAHDGDNILRLFEYAHRRYGASVFLVDNIMSAELQTSWNMDYYRAQANFVSHLIQFAKRYKVHVHIVIHPKKTENKYLTNEDVGGLGDLTNMVDNVLSMSQNKEEETVLSVLKNRMYGRKPNIKLEFDDPSKRFYRPDKKPGDRCFGWDYPGEQIALNEELPSDFDPFPAAAKGA